MSAAITVAAIGTASSVYSGMQAGQRADAATAAATAAYAENQKIAKELKQRQETMVDAPLRKRLSELMSSKITPEGQQALDRYRFNMGEIEQSISEQAPLVGEGVTGSRELTQQFKNAQGVASLNLQDRIAKNAQMPTYLGIASQTPSWANIATGANTQQGSFQERQANQELASESSSYADAAKGLGNIASMYAQGYTFGGTPAPTADPANLAEGTTQGSWKVVGGKWVRK